MKDFSNPFLNQHHLYNMPLAFDLCQQIHFAACQSTLYRNLSLDSPVELPIGQLKIQTACFGREILLAHPVHIKEVFQGVTLGTYQTIEALFNTPLQRSVNTVVTIMEKMALATGQPPLKAEAVWAICAYLSPARERDIVPQIQQLPVTWTVFTLTPRVEVEREDTTVSPTLVCVVEAERVHFLAVRVCLAAADFDNMVNLALYDALAGQRQPSQRASFGVDWSVPTHLECAWPLPENTRVSLSQLGIRPRFVTAAGPLQSDLEANWDRDLAGQALTESQLSRTFDYYLSQIYGESPQRTAAAREQSFYGLTGVNRNPGSLMPALRELLPKYPAQISPDGLVLFDGLHFEAPLLTYFPRESITVQRSPDDASLIWVYLNDDILCEARAQELKRADGTYRRYPLEEANYAQAR